MVVVPNLATKPTQAPGRPRAGVAQLFFCRQRMEEAELEREERRAIEMRLRECSGFTGFTCQIELSFDAGPRVYIFDLRTDWFEDISDLLDRIDEARRDPQDDPGPTGPYFSKN